MTALPTTPVLLAQYRDALVDHRMCLAQIEPRKLRMIEAGRKDVPVEWIEHYKAWVAALEYIVATYGDGNAQKSLSTD